MAEETFSRTRGAGDKLVGKRIAGKYQVVDLLTRGAMGKIYAAVEIESNRECAIKVLDVRHLGDSKDEFTARFFREASVAAQIAHPNVVTVFDYGRTTDGIYYIAMEYLHGRSLEAELRERKRLPWSRALEVTSQVCRGLREAHALDVLHRDLKPANVFLCDTGDGTSIAKIVDFGLAKILVDDENEEEQLTRVGAFLGSARYACPEQIAGTKDIDSRADLYAVGVMLYEMITGVPPFDGPNEASILVAHLNHRPRTFREVAPDVEVPAEVERVVMRSMSRERAGRQASAAELLEELKAASGLSALLVTHAPPQSTLSGVSPDSPGQTPRARGPAAWFRAAAAAPRALWGAAALGLAMVGAAGLYAMCSASGPGVAGGGPVPAGRARLELVVASGCKVTVDGEEIAGTRVDVEPGWHTVTCARGAQASSTAVKVEAGQTSTVNLGD